LNVTQLHGVPGNKVKPTSTVNTMFTLHISVLSRCQQIIYHEHVFWFRSWDWQSEWKEPCVL